MFVPCTGAKPTRTTTLYHLTFSSSCKRRSFRLRYLLDEPPILNKADRLDRSMGAHSAKILLSVHVGGDGIRLVRGMRYHGK